MRTPGAFVRGIGRELGIDSQRSRRLFYAESTRAARTIGDLVSLRRPARSVSPPTTAVAAAERVQRAYAAAMRDAPPLSSPAGLWRSLISSAYNPLQTALDGPDPRALANVLEGMFGSTVSLGLSMYGELSCLRTRGGRNFFIAWWLDGLACLAASRGLIPEEAEYGDIPASTYMHLHAEVTRELGIDLAFPEVCNAWGVAYGHALLPRSAWRHIHAARTLLDLAAGIEQPRVVEVGGGFGGVAMWLHRLTNGTVRYAIYDFPIVNAIAGYFLLRACPEAVVVLYGEPVDEDRPYLAVLPTWQIAERREADVTFNQDSLPEMPEPDARAYLEVFDRIISVAFYSDNQESAARWDRQRADSEQLRLPLLEGGLNRLRRVSRSRSWMRKGYVETIYLADGPNVARHIPAGQRIRLGDVLSPIADA